jgi:shikimate kinase
MEPLATYKITKPIVLVGMMGVGKTTYGKKAAATLKIPFLDIDQMIENEIGHSVSWIFENVGEQKFRQMEETKIKELLDKNEPIVLALGGGAFLNPKTRDLIKQKAVSIWLKSSPEVVFSRVSVRKDRPLLEGVADKLGKIREIMNSREEFYKQADISIETDHGNQKDIVQKIIDESIGFLNKE